MESHAAGATGAGSCALICSALATVFRFQWLILSVVSVVSVVTPTFVPKVAVPKAPSAATQPDL